MTTNNAPLSVTIVSPDTSLSRELCWLLRAFGYRVTATADLSETALWRSGSPAGLLLVDTRGGECTLEPCEPRSGFTYVIGLVDSNPHDDGSTLLKMGAHDVLRVPVSRGELLGRLKAAARRIEFERRLAERVTRDAISGMYTRRGLLGRLRGFTDKNSKQSPRGVLLAVGIDLVEMIRAESGAATLDQFSTALADLFPRHIQSDDLIARFGDAAFAVFLPNRDLDEARRIAEALAGDFTGKNSLFRKSKSRPTISSVLLLWEGKWSPDELVEQSLTSLEDVMHLGGNSIREWSELELEVRDLRHQMVSGNPFSEVASEDVMEPFPTVLSTQQDAQLLLEAFARISPPYVPLIDAEGELVGIANDELLGQLDPQEGNSLGDCTDRFESPLTVEHNESLGNLFEKFSSHAADYMVVVRNDRPLGYISREGLASLVDPINTGTYRRRRQETDQVVSLVVENRG